MEVSCLTSNRIPADALRCLHCNHLKTIAQRLISQHAIDRARERCHILDRNKLEIEQFADLFWRAWAVCGDRWQSMRQRCEHAGAVDAGAAVKWQRRDVARMQALAHATQRCTTNP